MSQAEQEQFLIDFMHGGCQGADGKPLNVDCKELWRSYQDQLAQPGCQSCIKRATVNKFIKVIGTALSYAKEYPDKEIQFEW
jgi:hypothetical protein